MARPAVWLAGLAVLLIFFLWIRRELQAEQNTLTNVVKQGVACELADQLYQTFVPVFPFVQERQGDGMWLLNKQMEVIMPLYGYTLERKKDELQESDFLSLDEILLAESWEEMNDLEETDEFQSGREQIENGELTSLEELLKAENEAAIHAAAVLEEQEELPKKEFVPRTMQNQINLAEFADYEMLVQSFYTIDANTMVGSDQLNVDKLVGQDMRISKEAPGPQILIYHTHSQEAFCNSVPGDVNTTIVGVGNRLCDILTNTYNYQVLHHMGQYDVESRDDAYSKALPAIEQVLEENPSIQVVIDLHRDQMPEEKRLVMDLDGRPTARFMFFNGLSRTRKTGNISYLYNENQEANLAFSFQMQLKAAEYYPGLSRKIYLKGYRYNMHLRPRTLLIELGAQNNTVEEAMNACDVIAHLLDIVLQGE